ncbi:uncharacterized protein [Hetaerina americana]|uniref:uncharacterized protein n=1 Tax=Hetaerina americana TaxID=62018 RepID=UPI003A7F54DE
MAQGGAMSEGVVREVLSGAARGAPGPAVGTLGAAGGGWGGGWGGGDSREWLAIAATAPLPLLGLSWALLVSRLHRRLWRPVDVFVAALLSAGIAKQALTLAFALLSLLLLPPDARAGEDAALHEAPQPAPPNHGSAESGWSWDSTGMLASGPTPAPREEALCSAAVWGLTSAHALQAAALTSLAADRALLALGSRPRRFRAAQARYHVCVLAVVSALVGAAGVFARGGSAPSAIRDDDDPCLFLPHQLDGRFALFWICLHGGLLLAGAALGAAIAARLCCCLPGGRRRDEEEVPLPSPCDTSTAASTTSTTASGRCGSTTALFAAPAGKCACGSGASLAFGWTAPPTPAPAPRSQDLRAELRWPTVASLLALYYLLNHLPLLAVTVLGTFAPWLLPRRWPLGTVVLWAGLAQDALLPLVLTLADSRFAGWARRVYSGAPHSPGASANELRRQHHQQQQQLRQQQLEQRRREQQQHLLHQQLQQQLQERRRRLEMTLDSPLPTARTDHEPAYAVAPVPPLSSKEGGDGGKGEGGPFHLAPPWKQKNSISVESLFTSKSDLSQSMSPPFSHQALSSASPSIAPGSTPGGSMAGTGGREKFPLTNGSLFTVGADGRYPVMRNYRRGSNGGHHAGRMGIQMVTNPRCDPAMVPVPSLRQGTHSNIDLSTTSNEIDLTNLNNGNNNAIFGCPGHPAPLERQTVVNRLEESESDLEDEPIYATLSSLEEDCEEEPEGDDDDDDEGEEGEDEGEEGDRPASPMSSCSMTTAANDDFEYRDAKGVIVTSVINASSCRQEEASSTSNGEETEVEDVVTSFRLPLERSVPSALGLYRLRLAEAAPPREHRHRSGSPPADDLLGSGEAVVGGALIRSPHNFHRRRHRRIPGHTHHAGRRLGVAGVVLSVDSLQTALSRPDAVAYLDNGERMSGSVPDFKKVFVSEFI